MPLTLVVVVLVVAAPLALLVGVLGLRRPLAVLLPVYAAVVPFGSALGPPSGLPASYTSLSSVLGFALIGALLLGLAKPTARVHLAGAPAAWLLLLGVVCATSLWTIAPDQTVPGIVALTATIGLYFLLSLSDADWRDVRALERGLVAGGLLASSYGLGQALTGNLPLREEGTPRFGDDLIGANHMAAALMLPLAITVWRAAHDKEKVGRRAHAGMSALLLIGVLLTQSRGGLLALAGVLVCVVVLTPQRGRLLGYAAVIVVVTGSGLLTTPAGIGERQTNAGSSGRSDIWRVGYAACAQYCASGSGWNTFGTVYAQNQTATSSAGVRRLTAYEAHNVVFLIAVEAGLVALLLFLLAMALTVKAALRLPPGLRGPPVAALAALAVTGMFLSSFEFKYFWLVLMYVALVRNASLGGVPDSAAASHRVLVRSDPVQVSA
jgi:hypothetical protein